MSALHLLIVEQDGRGILQHEVHKQREKKVALRAIQQSSFHGTESAALVSI
jgi:hypothetical protein